MLCSLVCLLDGYDVLVAPVSVPVLAQAWQLPPQAFTAMLTATVLGMALGAVFLAPLGDRYGRRLVIAGSFAVVGATSLLTSLSTTVLALTLIRLVTGLALGASIANALALASEVAPVRLRSRVTVCVYSMSALGSVFGGMIAPSILDTLGWQGLYIVGGVIPLLLVPVLYVCIPAPTRKSGTPGASDGTVRAAGVIAGIGQLLAPAYRSRTLLLWGLYFVCLFTMYVISSWLPTLMNLHGWDVNTSVYAIMVFSLGGILGGFAIGWLVDRNRTALALIVGLVSAGIAMALLATSPPAVIVWMVLIAVIGGGIIGVSYAVAALAAIVYPDHLRAGGIGAASAMGRLGATLAPVVGGWMIALGVSVVDILAALTLPMIIGVIAVAAFARLLHQPPKAAPVAPL